MSKYGWPSASQRPAVSDATLIRLNGYRDEVLHWLGNVCTCVFADNLSLVYAL